MLIGLVGKAESGKGEVAKYLVKRGWVNVTLARPLKIGLLSLGLFGYEELFKEKTVKSRLAMQEFGDFIRKNDPDYFVNLARLKIRSEHPDRGDIVVDDVRRFNEAEMIKEEGGCLVKILRPFHHAANTDGQHPTEEEQDRIECDYSIANSRNVGYLQSAIDRFLEIAE